MAVLTADSYGYTKKGQATTPRYEAYLQGPSIDSFRHLSTAESSGRRQVQREPIHSGGSGHARR